MSDENIRPLAYTIPGAVRASGLARTRVYDLIEQYENAIAKAEGRISHAA